VEAILHLKHQNVNNDFTVNCFFSINNNYILTFRDIYLGACPEIKIATSENHFDTDFSFPSRLIDITQNQYNKLEAEKRDDLSNRHLWF